MRILLLVSAIVAICALGPVQAQAPAPADRFDYFLFTLSWSPTYCAHHGGPEAEEECSKRRGFVVHGLWPQNEDGTWPAFCRPVSPVPTSLAAHEAAVLPNVELVEHEWTKHGSCTAYSAPDYFAAIDRQFAALRIPDALGAPDRAVIMTVPAARQAFAAINPGLGPNAMAWHCSRDGEAQELRLCLDRSMHYRACGAQVADSCPSAIRFPPPARP